MYLRPGNLYKEFTIEVKKETELTPRGRMKVNYDSGKVNYLKAILSDATPEQKQRWNQLQQPISHVLIQKGKPLVSKGDKLILESRIFFIHGLEDAAGLGLYTSYYAEERMDLNG